MIHPTACIKKGVQIADDVQIGPFCVIDDGVILESGVILASHVTLHSGTTIKKGSHLYAFVTIGNGSVPVTLGRDCTVREFTNIGLFGSTHLPIMVASGCYIMGYVDIRPGSQIDEGCIITNNVLLDQGSHCHKNVIIGAKASIAKHCTIGTGTMIGGASAVYADIPPYCLVEGYPNALIRGLNLIGMRRRFEDRQNISSVKKVFSILKKNNFSSAEASVMLSSITDPYAEQFVSFVATHEV